MPDSLKRSILSKWLRERSRVLSDARRAYAEVVQNHRAELRESAKKLHSLESAKQLLRGLGPVSELHDDAKENKILRKLAGPPPMRARTGT